MTTYQRNIPEVTQEEALALGLPTAILGPSQISMQDVAGRSNESYLVNWITEPSQRGLGHGGALMTAICAYADFAGVVLVTHPDDERLRDTLERYDFEVDPKRQSWEGKPLMVRTPDATRWTGTDDIPPLTLVNA